MRSTVIGQALLAAALVATATSAHADPKKTAMVFKSDGNADAKLRAKIDAAVLALAKKAPDVAVQSGDISFVDAAAAAGCKPEVPQCANDVIATFAVDEVVATTVTKKPGVTEVWVRRAGKGGAAREAFAKLATDEVQLDVIAPLFGGAAPAIGPQPPAGPIYGPQPPTTQPAIQTQPTPTNTELPRVDPAPPSTEPLGGGTSTSGAMQDPPQPIDQPRAGRGLQIAGMIGGGALILVGFGMWGAAGDVQSEIDANPKRTRQDFTDLEALETRGDQLSGTGNLLFLAGAVLGGISTYYFIKKGKQQRSAATAVIAPTLLPDGGGGIVFTWGAL